MSLFGGVGSGFVTGHIGGEKWVLDVTRNILKCPECRNMLVVAQAFLMSSFIYETGV